MPISNYNKLRSEIKKKIKEYTQKYTNKRDRIKIPAYKKLVKLNEELESLKLDRRVKRAKNRAKNTENANISITLEKKKIIKKIGEEYDKLKNKNINNDVPKNVKERQAEMNRENQLNEKLNKNENYQKIMKIINYYYLHRKSIPISRYQNIHEILKKLMKIRNNMRSGENISEIMKINNTEYSTKSVIDHLVNTIHRNIPGRGNHQNELNLSGNNGKPFRPGNNSNSFNNGTSQKREMFTHMGNIPVPHFEAQMVNKNNPFYNNGYLGGGKRYIHIKNIGKRLLRYNKSGRQYVIVKNKKKYL